MFSIILQTARRMLNSVMCTTHLSDNFNSVFNKKNRENFVFVQHNM